MSATPTNQAAQAASAQAQLLAMARTDAATFAEFAMRDERTGHPIKLAPMHEAWHRLIDQQDRLVIHAFVNAGKSSAVTVARTLFELGRDPSQRIAILSNTAHQAQKLLSSVARYITRSHELQQVFPALRAATPWGSSAITIQRPTISKDASVQALGIHGAILGARLDWVFVDDLIDFENSRTVEQRRKLVEWFDSTVLGRVVVGGRVVVLGTAWHKEDFMHVLTKRAGWHSVRYAIEDEHGQPRWPSKWPASEIAKKRQELGPLESARQLDVIARNDSTATFRIEDIAAACQRGEQRPLMYSVRPTAAADVVIGIDLASSKSPNADLTAMSVILVHRNGHREVINVESGRWDAPEILQRVVRLSDLYWPSLVVVESVAGAAYIAQMLRATTSIPVRGFVTGRGKQSIEWQARALAVELSNQKWTLRSPTSPEVSALIRDALYYSPAEHPGDRLVSLLMARWGAEQTGIRVEPLVGFDFSRR